jgi:hypothetical protein
VADVFPPGYVESFWRRYFRLAIFFLRGTALRNCIYIERILWVIFVAGESYSYGFLPIRAETPEAYLTEIVELQFWIPKSQKVLTGCAMRRATERH